MTVTGLFILASGLLLVSLAVVPEVSRRLRAGVFYKQMPFFYGWLVLFTGALGAFVAVSVAGVVLGGIQGLIIEEMRWKRSTIGFTATAGVWMSGLVAPIVGRLADRYGPRRLMPLGTLVLGLCLFFLGGVSTVWQFFVLSVVGRAISQPLLIGVVPRTLAVNFFLRRRNIALALTGIFRPVGGSINIQLISIIAAAQGWRTAFRYLGVASLLLTIPMVMIIRRRPEDIGLLPDGADPQVQTSTRGAQRQPIAGSSGIGQTSVTPIQTQEDSWTAGEAWRTRAYWVIAVTAFLGSTTGSAVGFNIVPHLVEEANLSTPQATGVLSLGTLLSLANLGWGYLADRFNPRRCFIWAMVVASGSILYLFTVTSLPTAYAFGVFWGLSSGASGVLITMLVAQYFGRSSYGAITGSLRPFEAGGLGLGQSLGAIIYDVFGTYRWLFVTMLLGHVCAAALIFMSRTPVLPRHSFTHGLADTESAS